MEEEVEEVLCYVTFVTALIMVTVNTPFSDAAYQDIMVKQEEIRRVMSVLMLQTLHSKPHLKSHEISLSSIMLPLATFFLWQSC